MNSIMRLFGFESVPAFTIAAPAIVLFLVTGVVYTVRALITFISQIKNKEIALGELVLPISETRIDKLTLPSVASCLLLALCGAIMSFFSSCRCAEGEPERDCSTVDEYWVRQGHGWQHWWQMMGDVLWLIIGCAAVILALCLVGYGAYKTGSLCWRYILKRPAMAIAKYVSAFKFRL